MVKNDLGQLQAKLNLNIEAEPTTPTAPSVAGAPTFTEKPKIVTLESGKLVQMIVRYKAESKCECQWFFKETMITETATTKIIHEQKESYYECRLEMQDPTQDAAGMYKCIVRNEHGEINANLTLNIQVAPEEVTMTTTTKKTSTSLSSTTVRRKKSVILQCAVTGETDVQVAWSKNGESLTTTQESQTSRFSVEKKASEVREHETIVQLEILDANLEDKGSYELVAISQETGDQQKQQLLLTEEQIKISIADEETEPKKKKKKVVKKKKKKEEKKEVKKPELSSFLKSLVSLLQSKHPHHQ